MPGSPNQRIGGSPPSSIRFNEKVQTIPVYNEDGDTRVRAQRVKFLRHLLQLKQNNKLMPICMLQQ